MGKGKITILWADGKKMVRIPSGNIWIGNEKGYSDEKPVHLFETDGFYMDQTPVTNAEFKRFCDATGKAYPPAPPWEGVENYFIEYPDYPVVNVSYADCEAYAKWAKKRLPTEEEWEYAARGGKKACDYPWGNCGVCEGNLPRANFSDKRSSDQWRDFFSDDGYRYTSPVGRYETNGYGLYDMAGNVYQYVSGWYFSYTDTVKSTENFRDGWGGSRVCRGGSFHSPAFDIRVSKRHSILGGGPNEAVGFRCVSDKSDIPDDACTVLDAAQVCEPTPAMDTETFLAISDGCSGPGDGNELCCGMGDANLDILKKLRALGFTSTERYVTWRSCEEEGKGIWNFSLWDRELENLKAAGLKWLPFIIAGPAYSLPDWYLRSEAHNGMCCVEHRIESKIQSFWDKRFYKYIDRFLKKLSEHFSDHSVFEGLLFGISGDFGEAIVSVWHGNWPTLTAGTYHAHSGYWCADRFAQADFRAKMKRKYQGNIQKLNHAWGTEFKNFELIEFPDLEVGLDRSRIDEFTEEGQFIVNSYADRVRIVDFIDWYRQSMTDYVGFWMKTARKYFPDVKLYLCTGGEAQPCHGSEFAAQSKICARYGAGVRITNEDSNFEKNFCITNWVASACTFYGNDFSFEPAGAVTERGVVCRIYNAAATGAKGLHFYSGNVLGDEMCCRNFARNIQHFTDNRISREIALFYPDTAVMFETTRRAAMYKTFSAMRDYSDYMYADDITVADGILKSVKALVLTVGGYYREKTLSKILRFVRDGGLLIGIGLDDILTIEHNQSVLNKLFGMKGETTVGHGKTLWIGSSLNDSLTDEEVNEKIFDPLTSFLDKNGVYISDGKRDRVYTACKGDGLLVMNYDTRGKNKSIILPDRSVRELVLDAATIELIR